MKVSEEFHMDDETKQFIETTFFHSLNSVNIKLNKLEKEEIDMKQFRQFILEQRVFLAEEVIKYYHEITLQNASMEESLLSIGKEVVEGENHD
jgi:hypothetical protein